MNACPHGERKRVTGKSRKTGRLWAAWMCPDKASGCDPQWVKDEDVFSFWKNEGDGPAADDRPPF